MSRTARFQVSGELLREALHMPPMSRFVGASVNAATDWDVVEFIVEDDDLPDGGPHDVNPTIQRFEWNWNAEGVQP